MSIYLMQLCWRVEFPSPAMSAVAVKTADYANADGENIYPSVLRVARETRLGESTVRRINAAFEECGLLEVVEEATGNRPNRSTTTRKFNVARLHDLSAVEERCRDAVILRPSTHVLKQIREIDRLYWRIVPRGPEDFSDYDQPRLAPLPHREGFGLAPPAPGGRPSQRERPTPPATGGNPSEEPSKDSPPLSPQGDEGGSDLQLWIREGTETCPHVRPCLERVFKAIVVQHRHPEALVAEVIDGLKGYAANVLDAAATDLINTRKKIIAPKCVLDAAAKALTAQPIVRVMPGDASFDAWARWYGVQGKLVVATMARKHGFAERSLWPPGTTGNDEAAGNRKFG